VRLDRIVHILYILYDFDHNIRIKRPASKAVEAEDEAQVVVVDDEQMEEVVAQVVLVGVEDEQMEEVVAQVVLVGVEDEQMEEVVAQVVLVGVEDEQMEEVVDRGGLVVADLVVDGVACGDSF
jgi:hypothetical protein